MRCVGVQNVQAQGKSCGVSVCACVQNVQAQGKSSGGVGVRVCVQNVQAQGKSFHAAESRNGYLDRLRLGGPVAKPQAADCCRSCRLYHPPPSGSGRRTRLLARTGPRRLVD